MAPLMIHAITDREIVISRLVARSTRPETSTMLYSVLTDREIIGILNRIWLDDSEKSREVIHQLVSAQAIDVEMDGILSA